MRSTKNDPSLSPLIHVATMIKTTTPLAVSNSTQAALLSKCSEFNHHRLWSLSQCHRRHLSRQQSRHCSQPIFTVIIILQVFPDRTNKTIAPNVSPSRRRLAIVSIVVADAIIEQNHCYYSLSSIQTIREHTRRRLQSTLSSPWRT